MTAKQKLSASFLSGIFTTLVIAGMTILINDWNHNKSAIPIPYDQAQEIYSHRHPFFSFRDKPKHIWYSYNVIDSFLKASIGNIKDSIKGNVDFDKVGVRIYFAAYTNDMHPVGAKDPAGNEIKWKNRETIFLVPTYKIENNDVNYDIISKTSSKSFFLLAGDAEALNHGTLCPPETNCNDGSAFK